MNRATTILAAFAITSGICTARLTFAQATQPSDLTVKILERTENDALTHLQQNADWPHALVVTYSSSPLVQQDVSFLSYLDTIKVASNGALFKLSLDPSSDDEPNQRTVTITSFISTDRRDLDRDLAQVNECFGSKAFVEAIAKELSKRIGLVADLSEEKRGDELQRLHDEADRHRRISATLDAMIAANSDADPGSLQQKIKLLLDSRAILKRDLHAKQIRFEALQSQREQIAAAREKSIQTDPVVVQLKKLVELRTQVLERKRKLFESACASDTELIEAETQKTEAELHLAERLSAPLSPGMASSLDQIQQEMTKIAVDIAEMSAQMKETDQSLAPYDLSKATTQSVKNASDLLAAADDGHARELSDDNLQKQLKVDAEILKNEVVKIELNPKAGQPTR